MKDPLINPLNGSRYHAKNESSFEPQSIPKLPDLLLDGRGLDPQTLASKVDALSNTLKPHQRFIVQSDQKPLQLLEALEARGFAFDCIRNNGSFSTAIWNLKQEP